MADEPNKTAEEIEAEAKEKAARDRAIAAIPAVFIDTWSTLSFTGHIRITFGEIYGGTNNFRSAIVLDLDDAESLGRHLIRVAERRRARDKEREARPQEDRTSES
jgi:hypothetical protein